MNDPFDPPPPPVEIEEDSWAKAAAEFVSSRIELIRLEAEQAGTQLARKAAFLAACIICVVMVWLLLSAGLIGLITSLSGGRVPWYGAAMILAALHLVGGVFAVMQLRKPVAPTFPLTRNQLAKDKEWLEQIKKERFN